MAKQEAEQKSVSGILDMKHISEGSLKFMDGIGNEIYLLLEFKIPSSLFHFTQEQSVLLHFLKREVKALILSIKKNKEGFAEIRCFVKGGYDAMGS